MQGAAGQSRNVIIDLRRCKMQEEQAIKKFVQEFNKSKSIKRMKIVKKNAEILDYGK